MLCGCEKNKSYFFDFSLSVSLTEKQRQLYQEKIPLLIKNISYKNSKTIIRCALQDYFENVFPKAYAACSLSRNP